MSSAPRPRDAPHSGASVRNRVIGSIAVMLLTVVVGLVLSHSPPEMAAEDQILRHLGQLHLHWFAPIAVWCDLVFGRNDATLVLLGATALVLVSSRSLKTAARFVALAGIPSAGNILIKFIVQRPRPDVGWVTQSLVTMPLDSSFPSGHTTFATSLGLALFVVLGTRRQPVRIAIGCLVVVLAALVGFSRTYLGVHFPTDVVASWIYSLTAVALVDTLWKRYVRAQPPNATLT